MKESTLKLELLVKEKSNPEIIKVIDIYVMGSSHTEEILLLSGAPSGQFRDGF